MAGKTGNKAKLSPARAEAWLSLATTEIFVLTKYLMVLEAFIESEKKSKEMFNIECKAYDLTIS